MPITNDNELANALNTCAKTAITNIMPKLLALLQDHIMKDTYGNLPNRAYYAGSKMPTFQFLNAWTINPIVTDIGSVMQELMYDYEKMEYFGEWFLHGNRDIDRRSELADDLNVLGTDLNNDWGGKPRKPFWTNFIWDAVEEDQIGKWLEDEFLAMGFN